MKTSQLLLVFAFSQITITLVNFVNGATIPSQACPTISQYDILKGSITQIKYIPGTSFYAVVDIQDKFVIADTDSGLIKSSYQTFSGDSNQAIEQTISIEVISSLSVYVVKPSGITIRDLSTMKDSQIQGFDLNSLAQQGITSAYITQFKVDPQNKSNLYLSLSVKNQPDNYVVLFYNNNVSLNKLSVDGGPPPPTVTIIGILVNLQVQQKQFTVTVGYESQKLYFSFIQVSQDQQKGASAKWDVTQLFPDNCSSIKTSYFDDTNSLIYIAFQCAPKNLIYIYDINSSQLTIVNGNQGPSQNNWSLGPKSILNNQINQTINLIKGFQINNQQYLFMSVTLDGQTPQQQLLFGTKSSFTSNTQDSALFDNTITAMDYVAGTSKISLGTSASEIIHFNSVMKTSSTTIKSLYLNNYSTLYLDGFDNIIALSDNTSNLTRGLINSSISYSKIAIQAVNNINQIYKIAIYDSNNFARLLLLQIPQPSQPGSPPIFQYKIVIEFQNIQNGQFQSVTSSQITQITITDPKDPLDAQLQFISSTTVVLAYKQKDSTGIVVATYSSNSVKLAVAKENVLSGQQFWMIADSNGNIIVPNGPTYSCYQYVAGQGPQAAQLNPNNNMNLDIKGDIKNIFFLKNSNYLGVFEEQAQGTTKISLLNIYTYNANTLIANLLCQTNINQDASNLVYSSVTQIIAVASSSKYQLFYLDTSINKLVSILETQKLGSSALNYFITKTGSLLIASTSALIKLDISSSCLSQTCTQCYVNAYYNIPFNSLNPSQLSDNSGSGTYNSPYVSSGKFYSFYWDVINTFSSLSSFNQIYIVSYIKGGSQFLNYQHLFDIYTAITQGSLGASSSQDQKFPSIYIAFKSFNDASSDKTKFYYFFSSSLILPKDLSYVSFEDIEFSQKSTFNGPLISGSSNSLLLSNVGFSTTDALKNFKVTNVQIQLLNGQEFFLTQSNISNLQITDISALITVNTYFTITIDSVIFDNCNFSQSNLIKDSNLAPVVIIKNSAIQNSQIIQNKQSQVFVSFSQLTISIFKIEKNTIQNIILFQNEEYLNPNQSVSQNISISQLAIQSNTITISQSQTYFGLYVSFSANNPSIETSIENSQIQQNTIAFSSQDQSQQSSDILTSLSQNFFFVGNSLPKVTLSTVTFTDNQGLGFMQGVKMQNVNIASLTCSQSLTTLTQSQCSCLSYLEHSKLSLTIDSSYFKNIFVINGYVISIITSSFTQVDSGKNDSIIKISNTQFQNILIQTNSEFITGSVINYESLQQDQIDLETVTFSTIQLQTPSKVFSALGSALSIYAPFSSLTQRSCTFTNLKSNGPKGPQEINVRKFSIVKGTFEQSNYSENIYKQTGGFGKITARQGVIDQTSFSYANVLTGGALFLVPTVSQSSFSITNSQFTMLSSIQDGGAIVFSQITDKTTLGITKCTFSYIFTLGNGGCLDSSYTLSTNSDIKDFTEIPTINMSDNTINDVFATQGSILHAQNMNINIEKMTVNGVDSNTSKTKNNEDISSILKDFILFGPLFNIYQSNLQFKNSVFDSLKIHLYDSSVQETNFMVANYKSILNFDVINITNSQFSTSNLMVINNSTFTCSSLNITKASYLSQKSSSRLLLDTSTILQDRYSVLQDLISKKRLLNQSRQLLDSSQQIDATNAISVIVIQKISKITASGLVVQQVTCTSNNCFGGGLLINQSSGTITSSNLSYNSATYGGGLAIYNPSDAIKLSQVTLNHNSATKNGGGLFFMLTSSQQTLNIEKSALDGNTANIGAGAFFNQEVSTASDPSKIIVTISDTSISQNTCNLYGGGISYIGVDPSLTNAQFLDNISKSSFGVNKFSSPSSLVWNKEKTNENSANQISLTETVVDEVTVFTLPDQKSAQTVSPLIFNLLDSEGSVITTDYTDLLLTKVTSTISVDPSMSSKVYLTLSNVYTFDSNNYFNYTNINIAGVPGQPVILNVQCNQIIDPVSLKQIYKIVFKFNLSYCVRGEVFQSYNFITPNNGAKTFYECNYCKSGTYSIIYPKLEDEKVHTCLKCSNNAQCPGGDVIDVNSGYWRVSDQDDLILSCENAPSNCLGGKTNSTCSTGHIGALCESCDIADGYTRAGNFQCANCGDVFLNSLKVVGLMAFYVLSAKMSVNGILGKVQQEWQGNTQVETNASIVLKLFLTYIQIIMVMTTFNISIPSTLNTGVSSVSSPTVQVLYSFECFFYQISKSTNINIIYLALIFDLILPIVCVIMFVLTGILSHRNNQFYRSFYIYTSLLYCLMYFQPNIFKDAISLASCRDIGNKSYIRYNVFFECGTDEYKVWTVRFVLPVILVLVFIIPGLILWRIKVNQKTRLGVRKFSFMTSEYKQNAFYWEIVKMNLKLFIMCSLTFLEHDYPNKIMSIFFLVAIYAALLFFVKPYDKELYNKIDKYSMSVLCLSIYLGFIAYYNNATFWIWLISVALIAVVNILFIFWCIQNLILAYIPLVKSQKQNYYNILMSIRFIRNRYFSKERRIRYLWMFWMKSLVKQLKEMKLYNPLSFDPEKNTFSRKMIVQALKEKVKVGEIKIEYEQSQDKIDQNDDNQTEQGDKKKYLKMKVIETNKFSSIKLLEKQQNIQAINSSPPLSQLTSTPLNKEEQIQLENKESSL